MLCQLLLAWPCWGAPRDLAFFQTPVSTTLGPTPSCRPPHPQRRQPAAAAAAGRAALGQPAGSGPRRVAGCLAHHRCSVDRPSWHSSNASLTQLLAAFQPLAMTLASPGSSPHTPCALRARSPPLADPISAFNISQAQQLAGRKLLLTERGVAEGLARGTIQVGGQEFCMIWQGACTWLGTVCGCVPVCHCLPRVCAHPPTHSCHRWCHATAGSGRAAARGTPWHRC